MGDMSVGNLVALRLADVTSKSLIPVDEAHEVLGEEMLGSVTLQAWDWKVYSDASPDFAEELVVISKVQRQRNNFELNMKGVFECLCIS